LLPFVFGSLVHLSILFKSEFSPFSFFFKFSFFMLFPYRIWISLHNVP
jgi:hypothetical protein